MHFFKHLKVGKVFSLLEVLVSEQLEKKSLKKKSLEKNLLIIEKKNFE
jgi:hypothetical protein